MFCRGRGAAQRRRNAKAGQRAGFVATCVLDIGKLLVELWICRALRDGGLSMIVGDAQLIGRLRSTAVFT